jgi:hypothetical protein
MRPQTVRDYTQSFFTWAVVSDLPEKLTHILKEGMLHLLRTFPDSELRSPEVYCNALDAWASTTANANQGRPVWLSDHNDLGELRLRINKSCLLDRLVYCGEYVRAVPCPEHKGKWSGIKPEPCPHGCDTGCGCLTGWLPSEK